MISSNMNKNNGKLLAAVIAMLMIVCAVAVVAMPSSDAVDAKPSATFSDEGITIASVDDLTSAKVTGFNEETKVLTVSSDLVLNVTGTIGSATEPAIKQVVLNGGSLQIKGTGSIFIANSGEGVSTVVFATASEVLNITGGVTVNLDANGANSFVINNGVSGVSGATNNVTALLSVTDKATLNVAHTSGKSTWYNADGNSNSETYMDVSDATVNFNGSHAIQGVVLDADKATITFNNVHVGMSVKAGSSLKDSTVTVNGSELEAMYIKGDITLDNSKINVTGSGTAGDGSKVGVLIDNTTATKVTMQNGAAIDTDYFSVATGWKGELTGTNTVTFEGGSVSGTFKAGMTVGTEGQWEVAETQVPYTLNKTSVTGNSTVDTDVVLASGENGFNVDGNLRNKGTVDTSAGPITVSKDGKFTNTVDGNVTGEKPISGAGTVTNDGTMNAPVEVENYTNNNTYEAELSGSTTQTMWYPSNQSFIVPEGKTWTITNGNKIVIPGNLTVEGDIVVEDGGVLVIGGILTNDDTNRTGFGKAVIDGTLTVEEGATFAVAYGAVDINGTADIDGTVVIGYGYSTLQMTALDAENAKATLNVNSDTALSEYSELKQFTGSKIVVASGVTMTLEGAFASAVAFDNNGAIVIDSEPTTSTGAVIPCTNTINIYMMADGASLDVQNLAVGSGANPAQDGGSIYVYDSSLTMKDLTVSNNNNIRFSSFNGSAFVNATISGLKVVEDASIQKVKSVDTLVNVMEISGTISASANAEGVTAYAWLFLGSGKFIVSDAGENAALSFGENTKLVNRATLTVSGYVPFNEKASFDNQGTLTLKDAGHVYLAKTDVTKTGTINAAYYVIKNGTGANEVRYHNYATLETAVPAVADAANTNTSKTVTIMGKVTVTENLDVPAGISIVFETSKAESNNLTIGSTDDRDVTVNMAVGSKMTSGKTQVRVEGTLEFADKTNDATKDTVSDVTVEDESKNGSRIYTNIYTALANATSGQTVEVTRTTGNVVLGQNVTVPTGVTLYVPYRTASLLLNDGVTMTVDGTLETEVDILAQTMFGVTAKNATVGDHEDLLKSSAIIVNGTLKIADNVNLVDYGYKDSTASTGSGDNIVYSSFLKGAPVYGAYYAVDGYRVISTMEIAFQNVADIAGPIAVNGVISVGDLTFNATEDCTAVFVANSSVTDMDNKTVVTSLTASSLTVVGGTFGDVDNGVYTNGTFTGDVVVGESRITATNVKNLVITDDEEDGMQIVGNVDKINSTVKNSGLTVAAGSVTATSGFHGVVKVTVASGATLVADGADFKNLVVDGTVTVASGKSMTGDVLTVNGTGVVNVTAGNDTTRPGSVDVNVLNLGIAQGDFQVAQGNVVYDTAVAGAATVTGPISFDVAYVLGEAVIDESNIEDKDSTTFYVDGSAWFTAYAAANSEETVTVTKAPVENADLAGWSATADGDAITSGNAPVWTFDIGAEDRENLYAVVNYYIYTIVILANEAVDDVFIDGQILPSDGFANSYQTVIAAGNHSVSYTLANGYSGEGVLSVVSGDTTVSGTTFTTSGTDADDRFIILQLTGFEKTGYVPESPDTGSDSGDSGMTITDYLLIVLVVLIVVMAIIVAMRLMRS